PRGLHEETQDLVKRFAEAMAQKLYDAEQKYGYDDGWMSDNWMGECRENLYEHLAKGDPRDVANYCAFLWHHKETTAPNDWSHVMEIATTMIDILMERQLPPPPQDQG
ncbi:MAG TPA: hypothetical protein VD999_07525, partial [Vitreimonas sp.]|nr:hypothetical protein [Vitreimonas sp.]